MLSFYILFLIPLFLIYPHKLFSIQLGPGTTSLACARLIVPFSPFTRSSSTWRIVTGSTSWNSKGSTRGGDNRECTEVQGVPNWRHLDLCGRPEVKRLIVWSAREMELLLKERAIDWQDIRTIAQQELVWVCKFCPWQNYGGWKSRVINRIILWNGVVYYFRE